MRHYAQLFILLLCPLWFSTAVWGALDKVSPLAFVEPQPEIPSHIPLGDEIQGVTYTLINNTHTASLPIEARILNAAGKPDDSIMKRSGGNCPPEGRLLAPGKTCTLIYTLTAPDVGTGQTIELFLAIDYQGRTSPLVEEIQFELTNSQYAYIANLGSGIISKCSINGTSGLFDLCKDAGASFGQVGLTGIAFAEINSAPYAYISFLENYVQQCDVVSAGQIDHCRDSSTPTVPTFDISFRHADDLYAYLATPIPNEPIFKCKVDFDTGVLYNCLDAQANYTFSQGAGSITFRLGDDADYAYILNGANSLSLGNVVRCAVQDNGDLGGCTSSGVSFPPIVFMDFATVNGTDYAYITAWSLGRVVKCTLDAINVMDDCDFTGPTFSQDTFGISISHTVDLQPYAYVVVLDNKVQRCFIDPMTGEFASVCQDAGGMGIGNFDQPVGITLH